MEDAVAIIKMTAS